MAKYNDTNWVICNTTNSGLPANPIRYINIDKYKNKWVCTETGGLGKYNSLQNLWNVYNTINSGLPSNAVFTITSLEQIKFISCQNSGFTIFNDTNWQTFNSINSPLPNDIVTRIAVDKYRNIWITTHGGIAIYNPSGVIAVEKNNYKIPESFQIYYNYPNPFNSSTKIRFDVSKANIINITIYDVSGKEIFKFDSKHYAIGKHEVIWNADNFSSGIYFLKMTSGNDIKYIKLVLLK